MKIFSLHEPKLDGDEIFNVNKCLKTGWLSPSGNFVKIFQTKLENFTKSNLVLTNSGTSALHLSLILSNVKKNTEVMVPTMSFIATINVVLYLGCHPIFFDCQKNNPNLDIFKVIQFLKKNTFRKNGNTYNKKTKKKISAIILTHVFGNVLEFNDLKIICRKYNIKIIEDAAEALGSKFNNQSHAGTKADFGILSFNINKIITSSGGGAIFIKSKKDFLRAKLLIKQSKINDIFFHHSEVGYNYGMSNISAAIGFSQLKKIKKILKMKKNIYLNYKKILDSKFTNIKMVEPSRKSNYWLNAILIENNSYQNLKVLISRLINQGIQARPIWYPCHKQKYLKNFQRYKLENADKIYKKIICLPSSYFLSKNNIFRISRVFLNETKTKKS